MKALGYVRVSTEEQARDGVSLDMQRAKIKVYADLEDFDLLEIVGDEGISGGSVKGRPGVQKVLQMVRENSVHAVIIYKLDRLARNTLEAMEIAQLLDRKGVGLHSITERLDTQSALGRFFFVLLASLAEMERSLIAERIRAAMERKRELGQSLNNNPEFGSRILNGMVVPNEQEQSVIRRIYKLREEGHKIHQIVSVLANEGYRNRKGKPFAKTQIHALIQRKVA